MIWAVATKYQSTPHESELPTAVCQCLKNLGQDAFLVEDGDLRGLTADAILLMVTSGDFPIYRWLLRHRSAKKPQIFLWQLDPLPPYDFCVKAESVGLKAVRWRDVLNLPQPPMPHWKKLCTLYRPRIWTYKKLSAPHYRKINRIEHKHFGKGFHWQSIAGIMENWHDILRNKQEGWIDHVIVSTKQRLNFLHQRGVKAYYIPVGSHEYMGEYLRISRDIPIGFMGATDKNDRRVFMLKVLQKILKRQNLPRIEIMKGLYGKERCRWLNRVRVLINIYKYPWDAAWIRFLMAARCGTLILSEPTDDDHPFKPGIHYIAAPINDMPQVINELLNHPDQINRVTMAANRLCNTELTLMNSMKSFISIAESHALQNR